jgi:hypothetical protein
VLRIRAHNAGSLARRQDLTQVQEAGTEADRKVI